MANPEMLKVGEQYISAVVSYRKCTQDSMWINYLQGPRVAIVTLRFRPERRLLTKKNLRLIGEEAGRPHGPLPLNPSLAKTQNQNILYKTALSAGAASHIQ